jgi:alkylation response protein AidB-like acyl-CoA dehydrogenase
MDLALSTEQREMQAVARSFCERHYPRRRLLARVVAGEVPDLDGWRRMGEELGLAGIGVPEAAGGFGGSLLDAAVVAEELGRSLAPVPFFSTAVLATELLAKASDTPSAVTLRAIAAGGCVAAVALHEAVDRSGSAAPIPSTEAEPGSGRWVISGVKRFVIDGACADHILVAAEGAAGPELFLVARDAPGLDVELTETLDCTRPLSDVAFRDVPAVPLVCDEPAAAVLERALCRAAVVLAAEQLGGAQRCLELAVDYAKQRRQFGRPIGSFQAVKHMCADVAVAIEAARWTMYRAAWLADEEPDSIWTDGRSAVVCCAEAFELAARTTVQVLGGIGFTAEHEAHLYLKRAHSTRYLLAGPDEHLDALADALGLSERVAAWTA